MNQIYGVSTEGHPAGNVAADDQVNQGHSVQSASVASSDKDSSTDPVMVLDKVRFSYPGGIHVLDDISLTVERGSIVGVVGPSGCGKSTLLSILAGLRQPTGGSIVRNYIDPARHPLTMVFQADTLAPWLTVEENVRWYSKFRTHSRRAVRSRGGAASETKADLDERIERLLEMVHLESRRKAYPYQLSGGMRRRLQFLSGVAPLPEVLLLDEPFSSVDEPTRVALHQDVFDVVRALKVTTILVTHDLAEAATLCDRVVILTNRPASIASTHEIPFGLKRDVFGIRATQQYLDLYGALWDDLSEQIRVTPLAMNGEIE